MTRRMPKPLISIDNVNGVLKSAALCQAIERPSVDIRILGQSKRVPIKTRGVSMFANGKNIVLYDDLTRRVIKILLDSKMERPELRHLTGNPFEKVLADRGKYVAACLIICRAYFAAGRPDKADPALGSFEAWSDVVRSALIWLGQPDPVLSMEAAHADDPVHIELRSMLVAIADVIGVGKNNRFTMRDVIDICAKRTDDYMSNTTLYPHLNDAVQTAAGRKRPADTNSLGYWMRSNRGDVIDNLRFVSIPHSVVAEWYVEDISAPDRDDPGTSTKLQRAKAEDAAKAKAAAEQAKAKTKAKQGGRPVPPMDDGSDIPF
jgi:putative DNA primase/helicase